MALRVAILVFGLYTAVFASKGTTPNIETVLLQRCESFRDQIPGSEVDCIIAVSLFVDSVRGKNPCAQTPEDYLPFIAYVLKDTPKDRVTFWSGLHDQIKEYGNSLKLVSLEGGTLAGSMLDGLTWCGSASGNFNYEECPDWGECFPTHVQATYWKAASSWVIYAMQLMAQ